MCRCRLAGMATSPLRSVRRRAAVHVTELNRSTRNVLVASLRSVGPPNKFVHHRFTGPWPELAGVPPRHRRCPPWSSKKSFRASSGHAKATTGCGWMSRSCRRSRYRRRTRRRRALAAPAPRSATALFRVTGMWGRLSCGSHRSAIEVE